jgi:predicted RNase H-like HicB family nuclease
MNYPAILTTEGTHTLISFPDCPGCQTFAGPGEDPLEIAQDVLTVWLEVGLEDGKAPPRPSNEVSISGSERVLVVPIPDELAKALEARWQWRSP